MSLCDAMEVVNVVDSRSRTTELGVCVSAAPTLSTPVETPHTEHLNHQQRRAIRRKILRQVNKQHAPAEEQKPPRRVGTLVQEGRVRKPRRRGDRYNNRKFLRVRGKHFLDSHTSRRSSTFDGFRAGNVALSQCIFRPPATKTGPTSNSRQLVRYCCCGNQIIWKWKLAFWPRTTPILLLPL